MGRRKKNQATMTTDEFVKLVNATYVQLLQKALRKEKVAETVRYYVRLEAEKVYIARSYRKKMRLKVLPRDSQINKKLSEGVKVRDLYGDGDLYSYREKVNIISFDMINDAQPDKPLFDGVRGKKGDLSKWVIGDAIYNPHRKYYPEQSHIHPLNWSMGGLDEDTWYDGDPYMERGYKKNEKAIAAIIQNIQRKCMLQAIQDVKKAHNL